MTALRTIPTDFRPSKLQREGPRRDGRSPAAVLAAFTNDLTSDIMVAIARGNAEMCLAAGLHSHVIKKHKPQIPATDIAFSSDPHGPRAAVEIILAMSPAKPRKSPAAPPRLQSAQAAARDSHN